MIFFFLIKNLFLKIACYTFDFVFGSEFRRLLLLDVIAGDTRHSEETFSVSETISCQTDSKPHLRLSGDFTSLSNKLCKQFAAVVF